MTDMIIKAMGQPILENSAAVNERVTDINQCTGSMKYSMIKAYTMDILQGTNDAQTLVSPKATGTRAEGTTILSRFAYPETRVAPDFNKPVVKPDGGNVSGSITIQQGQKRVNGQSRLAKEGDVVIKSDGIKVVLKKGPNGVLGEGQGVAPDLGFAFSETAIKNNKVSYIVTNQEYFAPGDIGAFDSLGNNISIG